MVLTNNEEIKVIVLEEVTLYLRFRYSILFNISGFPVDIPIWCLLFFLSFEVFLLFIKYNYAFSFLFVKIHFMIVFTLTGNGILQRVHDLNVMTCVKEVGISINFDKHYVKLKSSTLKQLPLKRCLRSKLILRGS